MRCWRRRSVDVRWYGCIAVVDRQQGAAENFAARELPYSALFLANAQGELLPAN